MVGAISSVYSLHAFDNENAIPFSKVDYSNFKYGSKSVARKFGKELGEDLASRIKNMSWTVPQGLREAVQSGRDIVVIPSPYCFIPTATYALKDYFITYFNLAMLDHNISPLQESKCFRQHSYNEDYGAMAYIDRKIAISSETFSCDTEFLAGKYLLFLDDIKITGAHQERMEEMINRVGLRDLGCEWTFVYYAELMPDSGIEPDIENYLNYYVITNLLDINRIITNDEFLFNTRNVKFMLKAESGEFRGFINYQSDKFRITLLGYSMGNNYHRAPEFKANFEYLKGLVKH